MSLPKLRIAYSKPAREDIAAILDYTEQEWGPHQSKQYRTQLREAINRLAEIPSLGRAREDLAPGSRRFPVGRHLVCYLVTDDKLFITRVLHGLRTREQWIGRQRVKRLGQAIPEIIPRGLPVGVRAPIVRQ